MVNLGLNWSSLLGIILAIAGAALYFLRTWRPKLARDHDIFFAAVGLLCGGILLFQGWRLDPILAFGQFLLTGTSIFFAAESISLRGVATQQAKSRTPIVDEDRPVSQAYSYVDAELDELEPVEEYPVNRRIRGSQEPGSSRTSEDEYGRRPPTRGGSYSRPEPSERSRRRRPRPESSPPTENDWEIPTDTETRRRPSRGRDDWDVSGETPAKRTPRTRPSDSWEGPRDEEEKYGRSSRSSGYASATNYGESRPSRKRRPPTETSETRKEAKSSDYVEYTPVESPEEEFDNSSNFDG